MLSTFCQKRALSDLLGVPMARGMASEDNLELLAGNELRNIIEEIKSLTMAVVVLPTKTGSHVRLRRVMKPEQHRAILLQRLDLAPLLRLEMKHKM